MLGLGASMKRTVPGITSAFCASWLWASVAQAADYPAMAPLDQYMMDPFRRDRAGEERRAAVHRGQGDGAGPDAPRLRYRGQGQQRIRLRGRARMDVAIRLSAVLESAYARAAVLQSARGALDPALHDKTHGAGAGGALEAADDRRDQGRHRQPRVAASGGRAR